MLFQLMVSFYIVFQALIAVPPKSLMQYFDVDTKTWKPLASSIPVLEASKCYSAISVGSSLFVAGDHDCFGDCLYQYDSERNVWETLSHSCGEINNFCVIDDHMYAISAVLNQVLQRYNFAKRQWQSIALTDARGSNNWVGCKGAVVHSKLFILHENRSQLPSGNCNAAKLNSFDPVKNEWEVKATTCQPHFESSLIVVNNRLYVAGGRASFSLDRGRRILSRNPAPIEMYNEENNTWSVVEQKHIPRNNLGAVELEGRIYFIINNFPIDSGIRIPPGKLHPIPFGEWENLRNVNYKAVLCHVAVKRESLKTE